ncbi:MAG: hypothetical protein NTV38_08185 [Chloroflexi bacterium]|nr:hypothetical protein [Chloroflexota bacterium]
MDRHYNNPGKCELCVNFVRFTKKEKLLIQPKIFRLDNDRQEVMGACLRPQRQPRCMISYYVFENQADCVLFEKGFYKETLGISCPVCKQGQISITRPKINEQPIIIIGCNRYPACKHTDHQLQLKTLCRYCGVPLVLTGGDLLRCSCPTCKRALSIPVSMKTWPGLLKPEGGCVHFDDEKHCSLCDASRLRRKSLIDLELPSLIHTNRRPSVRATVSPTHDQSEYDRDGDYFHSPVVDDNYYDRVEDYFDWADNYFEMVEDYQAFVEENISRIIEDGDGSWPEIVEGPQNSQED